MGQYWYPVNLDKKEYIDPHKMGCGLKLWEQLANNPGTGTALVALCAAMPKPRGGGDLEENPIIGHWAGDRIAFVGDYAELTDLPEEFNADCIYSACTEDETRFNEQIEYLRKNKRDDEADRLQKIGMFKDITDEVAKVIEKELDGKFEGTGSGWKDFVRNKIKSETETETKPEKKTRKRKTNKTCPVCKKEYSTNKNITDCTVCGATFR
jgi:hypothetical protein